MKVLVGFAVGFLILLAFTIYVSHHRVCLERGEPITTWLYVNGKMIPQTHYTCEKWEDEK